MVLQDHCPHPCIPNTPELWYSTYPPSLFAYASCAQTHEDALTYAAMYVYSHAPGVTLWLGRDQRGRCIYMCIACTMPPPSIPWLLREQLFSTFIYIIDSAWHLSVWPKLVTDELSWRKKKSLKICLFMFPCLCSCFMTRSPNHHRVMCTEMRLICLDVQADGGVTMISGTL